MLLNAEAPITFTSQSREAIAKLLAKHRISLTVDEALAIEQDILGRPPTITECILWSIQGSEHCSYKSSRVWLKELPIDSPQVILGPKEDAGIVAVATDETGLRYGIVMSHESHNHPSQIVPYEGAATGIGGNVRDVCCMGAEVIAVADGLRFGDIKRAKTNWIHEGVVSGIAGYGNPIGVPNLAGDVYYDAGYNENCLVTVVTLGVVREDHIIHSYVPANAKDYVFILVGKATDNSGFGGASFASSGLVEEQREQNKGAVQEPNAFLKRHLLKANNALFKVLQDKQLITQVGFKDLGAGGIACASVELADAGGYGAEIWLDEVATAIPDLHPAVALCSETQERFMWVVHQDLAPLILAHYNEVFALGSVAKNAVAKMVGKIRHDGLYVVYHHGKTIVEAKASDVTKGLRYDRPYQAPQREFSEPSLPRLNYSETLLQLLAHENIASRAPVYERYDKQVQGRTVIERGLGDAGLLQPFNEEKYPESIRATGVALSVAQHPGYNKIDPYWGAVHAVIEAARKVTSVGAEPIAITDCLCFGNPEKPDSMWEFVEAVRGIKDACHAIGLRDDAAKPLPVISGNVSLYNEAEQGAIPPSPMISCVGKMPNVLQATTLAFKQPHSAIILIGERHDECGGGSFYHLHGALGAHVPKTNLKTIGQMIYAVVEVIQQGLVLAAHNIAAGGLAVALAEMSFAEMIGCDVKVTSPLTIEKILFSESNGLVLEVAKDQSSRVMKLLQSKNVYAEIIGETKREPRLKMQGQIDLAIDNAKLAFLNGLREKLL